MSQQLSSTAGVQTTELHSENRVGPSED